MMALRVFASMERVWLGPTPATLNSIGLAMERVGMLSAFASIFFHPMCEASRDSFLKLRPEFSAGRENVRCLRTSGLFQGYAFTAEFLCEAGISTIRRSPRSTV